MAGRKQEQIHFSVSDQEKAVLEAIAKKTGRSISSLVKEASIRGMPAVVEDFDRFQSFAEDNK